MATKLHVKKNDIVVAIAGSDAAGKKTGKVLQVLADRGRVIVEGLHFVKKHVRKTQERPQGDIITKESSVSAANVMLFCPHDKKGVRVSRARGEDGRVVRKCKKCGHLFD